MKKFFQGRHQLNILVSAVTGTSLMTAYSYIISVIRHKNFEEPKLLGQMSHRLLPWIDKRDAGVAGWGMHYLAGLLFAEAYAPFWPAIKMGRTIKTGLVLGGISGVAAILLWRFTLDAHPFPPAVDFIPFAGQLFIAHLVFGVFAAIGYMVSAGKSV